MRTPHFGEILENRLKTFLQFAFTYFLRAPSFFEKEITGTYTTSPDDCYLYVNTNYSVVINLLDLEQAPDSQMLVIVDNAGNASGNNITINGAINGAASYTINADWGKLILKKTSAQYLIIGD